MSSARVGFAICGSFCTYEKMLAALRDVKEKYGDVQPIMSENSYSIDSRFGDAEYFIKEVENICGKKIFSSITESEAIGPKALFDIIVIAPCTGNTLAKIANGITDTSVTMACKAHLRNNRPVVIAIFSNDALSGNAENLGALLNRKNFYFVPFFQDSPAEKPFSLASDLGKLNNTIASALDGIQIQPLLALK